MNDRTFICSGCGETFEKARSDEDATTEFKADFGREPDLDQDDSLVCEDCYIKLMILRADWERRRGKLPN